MQHLVGSAEAGLVDGACYVARLTTQGMALDGHILYVAGTKNNAIQHVD